MSEPTIRVQKIKKDTVKTRLIVFGTLALLLLICSVFSEQPHLISLHLFF